MTTRRLAFQDGLCTTCRACELACSFALLGEFRPSGAGLAVDLDRETGAVAVAFGAQCARCLEGASVPCVAFCAPGALVVEG